MLGTQNRKKIDFTGKKIYVGIDVHKKNWTIAICSEQTNYRPFGQDASSTQLVHYLKEKFPNADVICAYEAGFSGFSLQEELTEAGIQCLVVHPADIPTTNKESEFKTDKRDARKIAVALRSGQLNGIHIPSKILQEARSLIRFRKQMRKDLTRQKCRVKSTLMFFGQKIPEEIDSPKWNAAMRNWIWTLKLSTEEGTKTLQLQMSMLEYIRGMRDCAKRHLNELANSETYLPQVDLLTSVPGFSRFTAIRFLVELGDINRFRTLNHLCNYIGLVPATHSSGEKTNASRLTYRGHRELRMILVESAWVAIGVDPALEMAYQEFKKSMHGNKAIIKIARKLLNRLRYVLIHQIPYEKGIVA